MVVSAIERLQLLGVNQTRALLPHLDQLCVWIHILHICLGLAFACDCNIRQSSLGHLHYCLLLWSCSESGISGTCGNQVKRFTKPNSILAALSI